MDDELRAALRSGDASRAARLYVRAGDPAAAIQTLAPSWQEGDASAGETALEILDALPTRERLAHAALLDRLAIAGAHGADEAWRRWYPAATRIVGHSDGAVALRAFLYREARTSNDILLCGESGVGVNTSARILHDLSRHAEYRCVYASSTAPSLITQELAVLPEAGTLVIPYVAPGDMTSPWMQELPARCHAIGTRLIVGGLRPLSVWGAPSPTAPETRFEIKPLRERFSDLGLLVAHFLKRHLLHVHEPTDETLQVLRSRVWGGNVRELEFAVRTAGLGAGPDAEAFNHHLGGWDPGG